MSEPKPTSGEQQVIFRQMEEFLRYAVTGNANVASLEGPIDHPTSFHTFIGMYPDSRFATVTTRVGTDTKTLYQQILDLSVPQRVLAIGDKDNPRIKHTSEVWHSILRIPWIAIAIGETLDTKESTTYIITAKGITPSSGLTELKGKVRGRLFKN